MHGAEQSSITGGTEGTAAGSRLQCSVTALLVSASTLLGLIPDFIWVSGMSRSEQQLRRTNLRVSPGLNGSHLVLCCVMNVVKCL